MRLFGYVPRIIFDVLQLSCHFLSYLNRVSSCLNVPVHQLGYLDALFLSSVAGDVAEPILSLLLVYFML